MTKESTQSEISTTLRDYDWKLLHILGTSSLAQYHENLLSLDLHVTDKYAVHSKTPNIRETISFEMNEEVLDKFISALESCQEKLLKAN